MTDTPDYRDELIATQKRLIALQIDLIATLRVYLKSAHETAKRHEETITAMKAHPGAGKGLQA